MDSLFEYFMWGIVGLILVIVAWRWLLLIIALALTINGIQSHPYITAIVWGLFIVMGIAGYIWEKAELENQKKAKKKARKEAAMKMQREMDQDVHSRPYEYKTGRHANETLAIRYGIANLEKKDNKNLCTVHKHGYMA